MNCKLIVSICFPEEGVIFRVWALNWVQIFVWLILKFWSWFMTVGETSLSVIYGSKPPHPPPPHPITRQYVMKSMNNSVFNQFIRMWFNRINF